MNRWILVDHLLDVVLTDEPDSVIDRLLRAILAFTEGQRAALFEVQQAGLRLSGSRGIGQAALDEVNGAWRGHRAELEGGRLVGTAGGVVQPVQVRGLLAAVLFTERTPVATFEDERDTQAMAQFARVVGRTLALRWAQPANYLAATTPEDVARDQLVVLLEQHEWNRVARVLGVTRPTIYARLARFGIPRRRIAKRQLG